MAVGRQGIRRPKLISDVTDKVNRFEVWRAVATAQTKKQCSDTNHQKSKQQPLGAPLGRELDG